VLECFRQTLWDASEKLNNLTGPDLKVGQILRIQEFEACSIHDAAKSGDVGTLTSMLRANPKIVFSRDDKWGATPLHWAAWASPKAVGELLLANGADVKTKDNAGQTPLHWAASYGNYEMAEFLLVSRSEINAKSNNGMTPLDCALKRKQNGVAQLLRKFGRQDSSTEVTIRDVAGKGEGNTESESAVLTSVHEPQKWSEPISFVQWSKNKKAAGQEADPSEYTSYVTEQFDKTNEAIKKNGVGDRFVVKVDKALLKEELRSTEGARAVYNTMHSFRNAVLISASDGPDKYNIDAMVAGIDASGKAALYNLPFGSGTVYALTGKVKMLGCTFTSAEKGSLYFMVDDNGNFVHVGGTGTATGKDGLEAKLVSPVN